MTKVSNGSGRVSEKGLYIGVLAGCTLLMLLGVGAVVQGDSLPTYSVSTETALNAYSGWCSYEPNVDDAAGRAYLSLFTNHYAWIDTGTGLILSAVSLAGFSSILRLRRSPNETWLLTPNRKRHFILLGLGVVGWLYVSSIYSLSVDLGRMTFPWCADSISIPMFGLTILTIIGTPLLALAGWAVTRFFGQLPARLDEWDARRPARSWIVSLIFAAGAATSLFLLIDAMPTSLCVSAPAWLMAIYLLAATRAALLSPEVTQAA